MATDTLNQQGHAHGHDHDHDHDHHDAAGTKVFGFWVYLMSDLVIFGSLFATYAVLLRGTADGPTPGEIFQLPFILVGTFLLLFSSFTYGMAVLAMNANQASKVMKWLGITFLLGAAFVALELYEFRHLIHEGFGPDRSGFLSAFFLLVGTHGLHVTAGLIWILVMMIQVKQRGLDDMVRPRIMCLSLFWHFLDIVWICVFSFVYLMGAL
ncbi:MULTISPECIES: cytochrome o ubiquinol oxidase subunit III [unclassified Halomonas]|uniref:cytochrome o ubiquinol oxidase subunit III n=1 Tax=unclassified Halomonas TaxID=2609666 RepID=UPI0005FA0ED3|nr:MULTISPECIES: cytochrome o ubiquinol oxidase subunit III [unclassified Halomonas]MBR9772238.1 cytochrome o ubiquinol oxidase subunit III [Gammaproteobacteria bacterium]MBS8270421.1 cytochrome o ubiquinol oxidase subunit III [Halomonas litopenaei]KJZ16961.1 cytochrome o ubiquinol oxidase subunit III [Halomonas sp. S2151]MAR72367.1 cytochrome o ubiquinol oxidase subunit III [Halomonas sp.]MBR9879874.1 cytochrome o ubiquinol oxidase subunit III [Gammaproteobacteria bacterium]|tara:strand:- start:1233 stop:1862 length:630 start_codon:yes stop_codon:yes gene_type:complete